MGDFISTSLKSLFRSSSPIFSLGRFCCNRWLTVDCLLIWGWWLNFFWSTESIWVEARLCWWLRVLKRFLDGKVGSICELRFAWIFLSLLKTPELSEGLSKSPVSRATTVVPRLAAIMFLLDSDCGIRGVCEKLRAFPRGCLLSAEPITATDYWAFLPLRGESFAEVDKLRVDCGTVWRRNSYSREGSCTFCSGLFAGIRFVFAFSNQIKRVPRRAFCSWRSSFDS